MDMQKLQYFTETCRLGNISHAADALHLSRQALSTALKNLESELGVALLSRSKAGIQLTEAGEILLESAQTILTKWNACTKAIDDLRTQALKPSVTVYLNGRAINILGAARIEEFSEKNPHVQFQLRSLLSRECLKKLEQGETPFTLAQYIPDNPAFIATLICKNPLWLLVSKDSPLAALPRITAEDLSGIDILIASDVQTFKKIVWPNQPIPDGLRFRAVPDQSHYAKSIVRTGKAVLPACITYVHTLVDEHTVAVPCAEDFGHIHVYLIECLNRQLSAAESAFKDHLIQIAQEFTV